MPTAAFITLTLDYSSLEISQNPNISLRLIEMFVDIRLRKNREVKINTLHAFLSVS